LSIPSDEKKEPFLEKGGPGWWKKKVLPLFVGSPDPARDALSFAVGMACAFLPPFGFHSVLVAGIAYLFRLSLPIGLLGSWTNNPWTFVPVFLPAYFAEVRIGERLLGVTAPIPTLSTLSKMPESVLLSQIKQVLVPFFLGSAVVAACAFLLALPTVYGAILWLKRPR
jgi:uncharacterized protein (DUF2062 family)